MASRSLISGEKICWICGCTGDLHRHHIFPGTANRRKSEKDGCWVYLCSDHHNMSNFSAHHNKEIDRRLKETCQEIWENTYGDRTAFIRRYGKNYLN